jgi:pimeloyl-ACP methyl ester carboxylesterase
MIVATAGGGGPRNGLAGAGSEAVHAARCRRRSLRPALCSGGSPRRQRSQDQALRRCRPRLGPRPYREPIFYLAGGPGGAAASGDAAFSVRSLTPANQTRDLVLVDQRGVGKSAPLVCPPGPPTLDSARACLRAVGRDPRLYTTDAALDDLDVLHQALHYRRIVLYGGSYGATAAQVYIARHGAHVAAAVLDGATLLDVPIWERMPLATQRSFDRLAARCAEDIICHSAVPDLASDLHAVLARLRATPVQDGALSFGSLRRRASSGWRCATRRRRRGFRWPCIVPPPATTATCSRSAKGHSPRTTSRRVSSCTGRSSAVKAVTRGSSRGPPLGRGHRVPRGVPQPGAEPPGGVPRARPADPSPGHCSRCGPRVAAMGLPAESDGEVLLHAPPHRRRSRLCGRGSAPALRLALADHVTPRRRCERSAVRGT